MEVFLVLPKTLKGQAELEKELAKFHAEHIQQAVQRLPCPIDQKLELIDAVIDHLKVNNSSVT